MVGDVADETEINFEEFMNMVVGGGAGTNSIKSIYETPCLSVCLFLHFYNSVKPMPLEFSILSLSLSVYLSVSPSVCVSVCVFTFTNPFNSRSVFIFSFFLLTPCRLMWGRGPTNTLCSVFFYTGHSSFIPWYLWKTFSGDFNRVMFTFISLSAFLRKFFICQDQLSADVPPHLAQPC